MQLKTIEVNGITYAETQDGRPIYIDPDGREVAFDAPSTRATINRLNAEARAHRIAKEEAEARIKAFEGLDDPEAARKALDTVRNLDAKKLIDAGEIDKVKAEFDAAYKRQIKAKEDEYQPVLAERDALRNQLHQEKLGAAFASSKFIAERLAIPVDLVRARFGGNFTVEDGRLKASGPDGIPIYSRSNPANLADFDEAIEALVDAYPYRDNILKGSGASGSGANGARMGSGGKRRITMAEFNGMNPSEQMKTAKVVRAGEAELVD